MRIKNKSKFILTLSFLGLFCVPAQGLKLEVPPCPAWLKAHGGKIGMTLLGIASHYALAKFYESGIKEAVAANPDHLNQVMDQVKQPYVQKINQFVPEARKATVEESLNEEFREVQSFGLSAVAHGCAVVTSIFTMLAVRNPYFCAGEGIATACSWAYTKIKINRFNAWKRRELPQQAYEDAATKKDQHEMTALLVEYPIIWEPYKEEIQQLVANNGMQRAREQFCENHKASYSEGIATIFTHTAKKIAEGQGHRVSAARPLAAEQQQPNGGRYAKPLATDQHTAASAPVIEVDEVD